MVTVWTSLGWGHLAHNPGASHIKLGRTILLAQLFYQNRISTHGLELLERTRLIRLGYFALGISAGLGLGSVSFYLVPLIGVAVSSAETVDELHGIWFPVRVLFALRVAPVSGGWIYGMLVRKQRDGN